MENKIEIEIITNQGAKLGSVYIIDTALLRTVEDLEFYIKKSIDNSIHNAIKLIFEQGSLRILENSKDKK